MRHRVFEKHNAEVAGRRSLLHTDLMSRAARTEYRRYSRELFCPRLISRLSELFFRHTDFSDGSPVWWYRLHLLSSLTSVAIAFFYSADAISGAADSRFSSMFWELMLIFVICMAKVQRSTRITIEFIGPRFYNLGKSIQLGLLNLDA